MIQGYDFKLAAHPAASRQSSLWRRARVQGVNRRWRQALSGYIARYRRDIRCYPHTPATQVWPWQRTSQPPQLLASVLGLMQLVPQR